uniref:Uncharacterized protein n=1 Tax=Solanum lycopersicum TaxID=4081 RepID=A0A3Q7HT13_SOLLC
MSNSSGSCLVWWILPSSGLKDMIGYFSFDSMMLMFFDDLTDGTSWFRKLDKYLIICTLIAAECSSIFALRKRDVLCIFSDFRGMVWNIPTSHLTGKLSTVRYKSDELWEVGEQFEGKLLLQERLSTSM